MAAARDEEPSFGALERAVARVVVSQALRPRFSHARASALDVLSSVLLRVLKELGHATGEAASAAGRGRATLPDALQALQALGVSLPALMAAASPEHETPFAVPLPRFPVRRRPKGAPSFLEADERPPPHVPPWAPALPDEATYKAAAALPHPLKAGDKGANAQRALASQTAAAEAMTLRLEERLTPDAGADYVAAAPGRWGGPLGGSGAEDTRRAEQEEATALGGASPYTAAPVARAPATAALVLAALDGGGSGAARAGERPLLLGAPPHAPAGRDASAAGDGWAPQPAEGAAAMRCAAPPSPLPSTPRPSHALSPPFHTSALPLVDSFSLESGARARAAVRAARGASRAPPDTAFASLRRAAGGGDSAKRARMEAILSRDPHDGDLLEDIDDVLAGAATRGDVVKRSDW